jgi:serine/threonine-protein kinase
MLGKGATGAVFLGRRLEDSPRTVDRPPSVPITLPDEAAIKVLILPWQLEEDGQADFKARFLREAHTLQRLQHPHIVSILDHGEDPVTGHLYMVLPYLSGGTLATALGSERMPLDAVASTLMQIADALDYAHSQLVVHRDIKPSNILLDGQHQAFIGDFSIARILAETHTRLTSTGRFMGTPEYMAPEQIEGRDVQAAADLYSLGMVVYRLVTGRTAFSAPSVVELIRLQIQESPPPPRSFRPDLPAPAEATILCALEKVPTKRFSSAVAFAHAFSLGVQGQWAAELAPTLPHHVEGSTVDSTAQTLPDVAELTGPPVPRDGARLRDRWRLLAVAAATLVLLVACLASVFSMPRNPVLAVVDQLGPHASVTATDGGMQANVTLAQRTSTAGSHPSGPAATGGSGTSSGSGGAGSGGGTASVGGGTPGSSGGGAGGGATQPTATRTATATATATATRVPTPVPTPTNPPPPPPPTYYETTSSNGSNTWTDYHTAGGAEGTYVQPFTTIQITCRLTGYTIPQDGNPWWYRIAQSPWNNQFYASADNFYNNGQTSGPPNSIFVDLNVPLC